MTNDNQSNPTPTPFVYLPVPTQGPTSAPTATPIPTPTPTPVPGVPVGTAPQTVLPRYAFDSAYVRLNGEFCAQVSSLGGAGATVINTGFVANPVTLACIQKTLTLGNQATFASAAGTCTTKTSSGTCRSTDNVEQNGVLFIAKATASCTRSIGVDSFGKIKGRVCKSSSGCTNKDLGQYQAPQVLTAYLDLIRPELISAVVPSGCDAASTSYESTTVGGGAMVVKHIHGCDKAITGANGSATLAMATFADQFFAIYAPYIPCN